MPVSLPFDEHLAALEGSGRRQIEVAVEAGLDATVPTCPTWDARALLAHQTMVHRWATANVTGGDLGAVPSQTEIRRTIADLPTYAADGLAALLDALHRAPTDLAAPTFLNDAPPPRRFWARRQAHETTIHMVDALAAGLGRVPSAAEAGVATALAADGIDELLCGFFTRGRSKLFDGTEYVLLVAPSDDGRRWVVHVAAQLTVRVVGDREPAAALEAPAADPAATLTGTAAELYLGLWNRGEEVEVVGRAELLDHWRARQLVRWR